MSEKKDKSKLLWGASTLTQINRGLRFDYVLSRLVPGEPIDLVFMNRNRRMANTHSLLFALKMLKRYLPVYFRSWNTYLRGKGIPDLQLKRESNWVDVGKLTEGEEKEWKLCLRSEEYKSKTKVDRPVREYVPVRIGKEKENDIPYSPTPLGNCKEKRKRNSSPVPDPRVFKKPNCSGNKNQTDSLGKSYEIEKVEGVEESLKKNLGRTV